MATISTAKSSFLIFVIGCPGAGKGTLCHKLATQYHGSHLSVGDLLRVKTAKAEVKEMDAQAGREGEESIGKSSALAQYIRSGTLVTTDLLLDILKGALNKCINDEKPGFVLVDGFPRILAQGVEAEKVIGTPDLVLFFDCGKEIAAERFQTRKLPGRLNDDMEMFEKRYTEFERLNGEIVQYYHGLGKLVEVDSRGVTEASYGRLIQALYMRKEWTELAAALGASEI